MFRDLVDWHSREEDYQPTERKWHSSFIIGNQLYILVGCTRHMRIFMDLESDEKKMENCSRVEMYDITNKKWYWAHSTGDQPQGMMGYCTVAIGNELFYFGGECAGSHHTYRRKPSWWPQPTVYPCCYHNSLHSLKIDTLQWRELSPTTTSKGHPSMKANCGMVHVQLDGEHYLAVIGGYSGLTSRSAQEQERRANLHICGAEFRASSPKNIINQRGAQYNDNGSNNEVHYFSLSKGRWITPEVRGTRPLPCAGFTLTSITNDSAVMFGGWRGNNGVYIAKFAKSSVEWTLVHQPTDPSVQWPEERLWHSSVLINTTVGPHLLVIGGNHGDCWIFNINTKIWKEFTAALPESVRNRRGHSLSVYSVSSTTLWIIVFGGEKTDDGAIISDKAVIELSCENTSCGSLYSKCQRAVLSHYEDLKEIESFLPPHILLELMELKSGSILDTTDCSNLIFKVLS